MENQVAAASCMAACPVQTDTRQYVELITQGKYEEALEFLLDANPFSSVCGRICHHPCEQQCRRSKVDAPVGLRMHRPDFPRSGYLRQQRPCWIMTAMVTWT